MTKPRPTIVICLFSLLLVAEQSIAFSPRHSFLGCQRRKACQRHTHATSTKTPKSSTNLARSLDNDIDKDTSQTATSEPVVIAMTREEGKNEKLRKQLTQQLTTGGDDDSAVEIVELPCIAHADGPDCDSLSDTLSGQHWDYVAVTSPEAARVLASAWIENGEGDSDIHVPAVAVVGKATEAALKQAGIPVAFCPSKATAKVLVQELPDRSSESSSTTPTTVLYPASAKAATTLQDGLTARGFSVTRLNTYDTVTATWTSDQLATARETKIVCVASPSSIKGWMSNNDGNTSSILAACIGETSAQACRELGFAESQIFYPDKPGIPGWVEAVQEALASLNHSSSVVAQNKNWSL